MIVFSDHNLGWLEHAPTLGDSLALCELRLDQVLTLALRQYEDESPLYLATTVHPLGQS